MSSSATPAPTQYKLIDAQPLNVNFSSTNGGLVGVVGLQLSDGVSVVPIAFLSTSYLTGDVNQPVFPEYSYAFQPGSGAVLKTYIQNSYVSTLSQTIANNNQVMFTITWNNGATNTLTYALPSAPSITTSLSIGGQGEAITSLTAMITGGVISIPSINTVGVAQVQTLPSTTLALQQVQTPLAPGSGGMQGAGSNATIVVLVVLIALALIGVAVWTFVLSPSTKNGIKDKLAGSSSGTSTASAGNVPIPPPISLPASTVVQRPNNIKAARPTQL